MAPDGPKTILLSAGCNENNMARNNTRIGRRRRVLNEEVLSASSAAVADCSASTIEPGDTPRYGVGANIENHPQVTSLVPRRYRTLSLIAAGAIAAGATAELVAHFAGPLSELTQVVSPAEITATFSTQLVAWTSATLLLLAAGYTRLVYSLRRHRVDDERGRYRIWRVAGMAAVLLSFNAIVGGHELVARCLGSLVDWQMLPASAGWWLVPAALLGGGLLTKVALDAAECRGALTFYILAGTCLTVAGVHSAGWSPAWAAEFPGLIGRLFPLLGHTFLLVGSMLFARYVILDVQGLIEHTVVKKKSKPTVAATETPVDEAEQTEAGETYEEVAVAEKPAEVVETYAEEVAAEPAIIEAAPIEQSGSIWTDGTEPEVNYDDEDPRRMSKSERKRQRKQKNRNRAA